ncbi:unnamed protein product [Closterium sp. NIES-54]
MGCSRACQVVHVTATLPADVHQQLLAEYPTAVSLIGPSLHLTSSGLHEVLVDCSQAEGEQRSEEGGFARKRAALLQIVGASRGRRRGDAEGEEGEGSVGAVREGEESSVGSKKTIVFCNKVCFSAPSCTLLHCLGTCAPLPWHLWLILVALSSA